MAEAPSSNWIIRIIQRHYGDTKYERTEKQIASERTLLFGIPFNRWLLFPAAVFIQFCCGSLYAWSVYNKPIDLLINGNADAGQAPITFYIAVGFFGFSAAIMGPWLERNGPRKASLLGSSLFLVGNALTAVALHVKLMWLVYIGYGVVGGFGLGLTYISPVSALQKWFPDFRGMAAGFAVCGFGAGSIAFAQIIGPLVKSVDLPLTFTILGLSMFVIMFCCAMLLRIPPPGYSIKGMTSDRERTTPAESSDFVEPKTPEKADIGAASPLPGLSAKDPSVIKLTLIESLKSREYLIIYIVFFANSIFGLVVISRLANMVQDLFGRSKEDAATIVSINGGLNLAGRLIFATLSDKLGRKGIYCFFLTCQSIVLIVLPTILNNKNYPAFLVCMFLLTACYGGGFGIIPAFLSDMFGSGNTGACHGVVLTAWSIAGVAGGLIFTAVYNNLRASGYPASSAVPYNTNIYWILALVLIGWIIVWFLRVKIQDRLLPKQAGEVFRIRVLGRLFRYVKGSGIVRVSEAQQQLEWEDFVISTGRK